MSCPRRLIGSQQAANWKLKVRDPEGREERPSCAIIGSRSVRTGTEARRKARLSALHRIRKSGPKSLISCRAPGVSGPRGKGWGPSTLFGNVKRGTGILNNELYIGKLVWNRLRYIKDPDTGKRVSRLNPKDQWIIHELPQLRIIDDDLWASVKTRQIAIRERYVKEEGNGLTAARRSRYLFSGLVKCAECGGGYSMVCRDQFGCSTVKNKGTCANHVRITRQELETRVLNALRNHLMAPERFQTFCEAYTREINRLRIEGS
ncbi:recombinase family protein, partial [Iodidimonas gelatinilytica]|uniref:recombinase family protein n=1 Tax=Iodidimonas gelatinilytica TaxID=1236966 RepID=UPI001B2FF779